MKIMIVYLIIINLVGFITMYRDKKKAINRQWRIPEQLLFFMVIIGGSIGGILGMKVFRHKTKHWQFKYGFPLVLIVQIVMIYYLLINK